MRLSDRYQNLKPSDMVRIFQAIEKMEDVVNLSIGEPDFDTDHSIIDAAAKAAKEGFTHYPPLMGFTDIREAVCAYWQRHHGLNAVPENVVITVGALQSIYLALAALLNPGDEVLLFEPYFTPYAAQTRAAGGVPVPVLTNEENGFTPTIDDLRSAATSRTRGIVINSPCNPSGCVMTRTQMKQIADFAEERDLFVISDEIYESLIFNGKEHTCFAALPGMKDRTVLVSGVSKSHCMTGWRLGYAVAPENLAGVMSVIASGQTYGVNTLSQKGACYALNNLDAVVKEHSAVFGERLSAVQKRLSAMKGVTCRPADGAFYLFPCVRETGLSGMDFAWRLLNEAKVGVVPGDAFGSGVGDYVRIACTRSTDELMRGMDRMEAFVNKL